MGAAQLESGARLVRWGLDRVGPAAVASEVLALVAEAGCEPAVCAAGAAPRVARAQHDAQAAAAAAAKLAQQTACASGSKGAGEAAVGASPSRWYWTERRNESVGFRAPSQFPSQARSRPEGHRLLPLIFAKASLESLTRSIEAFRYSTNLWDPEVLGLAGRRAKSLRQDEATFVMTWKVTKDPVAVLVTQMCCCSSAGGIELTCSTFVNSGGPGPRIEQSLRAVTCSRPPGRPESICPSSLNEIHELDLLTSGARNARESFRGDGIVRPYPQFSIPEHSEEKKPLK